MDRGTSRSHALIGAAALLCVLVVPLTATGAVGGSGGPEATASGVKKQIKKLKRKVKKLQQQVDEIAKQPGPQGEPGPQGPQGDPGQNGATNVVTRRSAPFTTTLIGGGIGGTSASCNTGERAVGGGGTANSNTYALHDSQPTQGSVPTGWNVSWVNRTANSETVTLQAYVICASP
jgi:hypothetical protein